MDQDFELKKEYDVIGYNVLLKVNKKETEIKNDVGIIIASDESQHVIMSGKVINWGHLVNKDYNTLGLGDVVYFYDMDLKKFRINGEELGIIHLDNIKLIDRHCKGN